MTTFEMVKYHNQIYPAGISLRIEEIAAHFDAPQINASLGRSLHTEYSVDNLMKYHSMIFAQRILRF